MLKKSATIECTEAAVGFDLSVTPTEEIPDELGNLTKLRHLFISTTFNDGNYLREY